MIYFASSLEKPQYNYGSSKSNQAEIGRAISIIHIFREASLCLGLPRNYFLPHQREAKNHPDGLIIDRIFMDDNTTNKGGRPKKKLSEKRSYSVLLKLNTKEYFTLKSKANEAGLNKSEYLRTLIYESQVKARITPEQMNEIRQLHQPCIST